MTPTPKPTLPPESPAGRALRALCAHEGPMPVPTPVRIGRRTTRPGAPYARLVRLGLAVKATYRERPHYEPTAAGRALLASW